MFDDRLSEVRVRQAELAGELRLIAERVARLDHGHTLQSTRLTQVLTRTQELQLALATLTARVDLLAEILKWLVGLTLVVLGAWSRLPEPLRWLVSGAS